MVVVWGYLRECQFRFSANTFRAEQLLQQRRFLVTNKIEIITNRNKTASVQCLFDKFSDWQSVSGAI